MGRPRILRARPQPSCLCANGRERARRLISPALRRDLRALPGIGLYTAAAIAAIAFRPPRSRRRRQCGKRVVSRSLRDRDAALPASRREIRIRADELTPDDASRRFRASDDGSRGDDLHADTAGLHPMPLAREVPSASAKHSGRLAPQIAETGPAVQSGLCVRCDA